MAGITLAHTFVSAKGNGTDLTLIQPSNWNDQHTIKLDANNLLGKLTAGNGPVEQVPLSTYMSTLLAAADAPTLAGLIGLFSTGDGKLTLKVVPDTGWLMLDDGTFGNAGSGASNRANADTQALFTLIYNNISDAGAPVLTSVGGASTRAAQGSAATAWAALCRLSLPKQLGRAFVGAGTGAGLTARALGTNFGEESHLLTIGEMPSHSHGVNDPGHAHNIPTNNTTSATAAYISGSNPASLGFSATSVAFTGITLSNTGGGATHNNTQASAAWNCMVKL